MHPIFCIMDLSPICSDFFTGCTINSETYKLAKINYFMIAWTPGRTVTQRAKQKINTFKHVFRNSKDNALNDHGYIGKSGVMSHHETGQAFTSYMIKAIAITIRVFIQDQILNFLTAFASKPSRGGFFHFRKYLSITLQKKCRTE